MLELVQGTTEWKQARCGLVTASRVADVVAKTKTGWGASRANYMGDLIAERLTGAPAEGFTNAAMQWGNDQEPAARIAYEFMTNASVEQVGLVLHPTIGETGASPDGLIGKDGLVEIKCPNTSTHIDTLLGQKVPEKYLTQIQWQLACTKRQWCDFVSYDPRMPATMELFVQRVERDSDRIAELEAGVVEFLAELRKKVDALRSRYEPEELPVPVRMAMAG